MTSSITPLAARPLGRSGLSVSELALGTMTFGVETDEAEAHAQLDAFVAAGGTLIDTADVYGGGASERIIGTWLKSRGAGDTLIATKGRFAPPPGASGASRRGLAHAIDASLSRLGVDAIDLYLVHGWDQDTPVSETLDVLAANVRAGKIHAIGWSNVTGWQLGRILAEAELRGLVAPSVVQPQYNLLDRGIETEVLPACLEHGVAVTPWSPLGGGWLTGKYQRDQMPTGSTRLGDDPARGVEAYDTRNNERTWQLLDVVRELADRYERPMGHVAIAWLLGRPGVASVLLGARTLAQLHDNLAASTLQLNEADAERLTAASAPGLAPYPYGMVEDFCNVPYWQQLGTRRLG